MAVIYRLKPVRSDTLMIKRKPSRSTTSYAREKAQFLKKSRDYAFLSSAAADDDVKAEPVPVRPVPIKKANIGSRIEKKPSESIERKANDARLGTNCNKLSVLRSLNKPLESIVRKADARLGTNKTSVITNSCSRSIKKPCDQSINKRIKDDYYDHGGNSKKKVDVLITRKPYYDKECSDQSKITTKKRRVMKQYDDDMDEEEEEAIRAIAIIREMYGYDPTKYRDRDRDDLNMEVGFQDIQREERRSAKLARKEDADELRKLMGQDKKNNKKKIKQ